MTLVSLDTVRARLCDRLDDWVPRYFSHARRDGEHWRMGDIDGAAPRRNGQGGSCVIQRRGQHAGRWHDFASGEGDGVLDTWRRAIGARDMAAAIQAAREYCGLGQLPDGQARAESEAALQARAEAERRTLQDEDRRARHATALWLEGVPLPGTMLEIYFLGRGLALSQLGKAPGALRFHAALRCPEQAGLTRPGMVACIVDGEGRRMGCHRTFLHRLGDGRVVKASDPAVPERLRMADAKKCLGPMRGGFVSLSKGVSNRPMRDMPPGEWLRTAEGIEDGLAVMLADPSARVVSHLSISNLAHLRPPNQAGGVVICAQNDDLPVTIAAFDRGHAALAARVATVIARPPRGVKDWNDWSRLLEPPLPAARPETAA